MVRNRRARADAMVLRSYVASILASRSLLEPLTDKQLSALLNNAVSLRSVRRARRWVERAHQQDRLAGLADWLRRLRRGEQPDTPY
jgi:hypothetical protein